MDLFLQALLALLLLAVALHVQMRVATFTAGTVKVAITRSLLVLAGIGFGLTGATRANDPFLQVIAFAIGFGLVHIPAAVILFIKGRRGEGKS